MDNLKKLAERIRPTKIPQKIGALVGTVVGLAPLKVEIGNIGIFATQGKNLIIASHLLKNYRRRILIDTTSMENEHIHTGSETDYETLTDILQLGDKVIIIASDNNQRFFVIDKAVF